MRCTCGSIVYMLTFACCEIPGCLKINTNSTLDIPHQDRNGTWSGPGPMCWGGPGWIGTSSVQVFRRTLFRSKPFYQSCIGTTRYYKTVIYSSPAQYWFSLGVGEHYRQDGFLMKKTIFDVDVQMTLMQLRKNVKFIFVFQIKDWEL